MNFNRHPGLGPARFCEGRLARLSRDPSEPIPASRVHHECKRKSSVVHPALAGRRPEPGRHLGPEANLRLQADLHKRSRHPDFGIASANVAKRMDKLSIVRSMHTMGSIIRRVRTTR